MDLGTSSPHAKFAGDLDNATEDARIVGRVAFEEFTKNSDPCNFRLLQQNRREADVRQFAVFG